VCHAKKDGFTARWADQPRNRLESLVLSALQQTPDEPGNLRQSGELPWFALPLQGTRSFPWWRERLPRRWLRVRRRSVHFSVPLGWRIKGERSTAESPAMIPGMVLRIQKVGTDYALLDGGDKDGFQGSTKLTRNPDTDRDLPPIPI